MATAASTSDTNSSDEDPMKEATSNITESVPTKLFRRFTVEETFKLQAIKWLMLKKPLADFLASKIVPYAKAAWAIRWEEASIIYSFQVV